MFTDPGCIEQPLNDSELAGLIKPNLSYIAWK